MLPRAPSGAPPADTLPPASETLLETAATAAQVSDPQNCEGAGTCCLPLWGECAVVTVVTDRCRPRWDPAACAPPLGRGSLATGGRWAGFRCAPTKGGRRQCTCLSTALSPIPWCPRTRLPQVWASAGMRGAGFWQPVCTELCSGVAQMEPTSLYLYRGHRDRTRPGLSAGQLSGSLVTAAPQRS